MNLRRYSQYLISVKSHYDFDEGCSDFISSN